MLFVLCMGGGGLYGAHSLADEGLKILRPYEQLTVYVVFSETANRVMGGERRARVGLWAREKWSAINEWVEMAVLSERTPIRRVITRQVRKLGWTTVVCGLYVIGNLVFAWLTSMGVALIKTLDGTEHWIADVLIWGCGLIEMAIGLCMICVFGVWFKDYINGLIKEFRKDMEEDATTTAT
ncbi:hypothetical protein BJ165DRAFT_1510899 [Panaeolus papilionaceus]|nr:hypothetical protein BJ165DRAFT_1510899 [Panaeolus papilionaceus]